MSIVDLAKARAFADVVAESEAEAADWIRELADEVQSLRRALEDLRAQRLDAATTQLRRLEERDRAIAERDAAVAGLQELYDSVSHMLREARHIVDNHPDPAAAGAAMRILGTKP